jgi:hypothetical protein
MTGAGIGKNAPPRPAQRDNSKNRQRPEAASIVSASRPVEVVQHLPYLVILKGILNATFIGIEIFFAGSLRSLAWTRGDRPARRVIIGNGSLLVCHSSSPSDR